MSTQPAAPRKFPGRSMCCSWWEDHLTYGPFLLGGMQLEYPLYSGESGELRTLFPGSDFACRPPSA